jgi:hypothetical protein
VSRHASDRTPSSSVKCARSPAAGLTLSLFQHEITGVALACEVVAVGMAAATPIRTGGGHLVPEEAVVAGDSAPARCRDRTEVMRRFAVSGEVIVPRAIGAAFALLELFSGQCVVSGVLAVPRDPTARSSSQSGIGPGRYVGAVGHRAAPVSSVSPCQFPLLVIFIH